MTIDLVGKLHRTVYVANCPSTAYEDLARFMMLRCGAVEAWTVLENNWVVIVFESMNSVSNALAFHGFSFGDLTVKLIVWRAKDPPPAGAPKQFAITGPVHSTDDIGQWSREAGNQNGSSTTASASSSPPLLSDEERRKWLEKRQQGRTTIQELAEAAEKADRINAEGKEARMKNLCYRQAMALVIILEDAIEKAKIELDEKNYFLAASTSLLHST